MPNPEFSIPQGQINIAEFAESIFGGGKITAILLESARPKIY